MDQLAMGCLAGIFFTRTQMKISRAWYLAGIAFLMLGFSPLFDPTISAHPIRKAFGYSFLGLGSTFLVFLVAYPTTRLKALENAWLARIGTLSYSMYLYHFVILLAYFGVKQKIGLSWNIYFDLMLVLGGSIVFSYCTYLVIERRFSYDNLVKRRMGPKTAICSH
jgi:peptidoglycan/LPS O-acetylase OafA/YrhL